MKFYAVFVDHCGLWRRRMREIETFLLLHMVFCERIKLRVGKVLQQTTLNHITLLEHSSREIFDHDRVGEKRMGDR